MSRDLLGFFICSGDLEFSWQSQVPVHQLNQNLIQNRAANQLLFRELICSMEQKQILKYLG